MKKIEKIIEMDIDLDEIGEEIFSDTGVEIVSIVDEPAVKVDFMYFNKVEMINPEAGEDENDFIGRCMSDEKMKSEYPDEEQRLAVCYSYYEEKLESYGDYPEAARNNACRALKWAEENGWGSCGEATGKQRANQLCKGEKISRDTISRMSSFKRHQQHKDVPYSEGCGGLMWDAWGGSAGINWAQSKLDEIEKEKLSKVTLSLDEEQRIVTGVLMVPNKMILRRTPQGEPYYIFFSRKTIKKMAEKFFKLNKHNNTDINHDENIVTKNTLLESWISESTKYDKGYTLGFNEPPGTWFISYKINDEDTWQKIKSRELRGFSLAGSFIEKLKPLPNADSTLDKIKDILNSVNYEK